MKKQVSDEKLRLIVFKSALELGRKVDEHLLEMYGLNKDEHTFIIPIKENFFEDGHLKVEIDETVRGKDLYFLTDIGNYSITYKMHGFINHASPNDLFFQLKDGIGASNCHAEHINVVMPLLYNGRQHRRNTRESLSCGASLRELDEMSRIKSFITFDAHDQGVEHAVRNMEFDNFFATNMILEQFIQNTDAEQLKNIVFIAPDNGATGRRNVYLNSFNSSQIHKEAGSFIKERDFNNFVDGKYPIIAHNYSGNDNLEGKTAIIIDDMISSGGSILEVVDELKRRNVAHVYVMVTYALLTRGIEGFDKYYREGKIDGLYTTNLSYIPEEYKNNGKFLYVCDCSKELANIIYNIHNDLSISGMLNDRSRPGKLLEKKFNGR